MSEKTQQVDTTANRVAKCLFYLAMFACCVLFWWSPDDLLFMFQCSWDGFVDGWRFKEASIQSVDSIGFLFHLGGMYARLFAQGGSLLFLAILAFIGIEELLGKKR